MTTVLRRAAAAGLCGVLAAAGLGGCASYSHPTLTLTGVESVEETPGGLVLRVRLRADNDNEVSLPLREVDYTARVGEGAGALTFTGRRSPEATLRRKGSQELVLPVALRLDGGDGGRTPGSGPRPIGKVPFILNAQITYLTPGALAEVLFDADVRRPVARVSTSGVVDLGSGPGAPAQLVQPAATTP
jgi:hypothetical protein